MSKLQNARIEIGIGAGVIEGRLVIDATARPDLRAARRAEFLRTTPRPPYRDSPALRQHNRLMKRTAYDELYALRSRLEELRWCLREGGR